VTAGDALDDFDVLGFDGALVDQSCIADEVFLAELEHRAFDLGVDVDQDADEDVVADVGAGVRGSAPEVLAMRCRCVSAEATSPASAPPSRPADSV